MVKKKQFQRKQGKAKDIKFHEKQLNALISKARFTLAVAGTQGGKTHVGSYWIQIQVEKDLDADYLISAPTNKILDQATLPKFFENNILPGRWYEQKREWRLEPFKGKIFVRSAEEPDNVESMTLKGAWLDEAGKMKAKMFPVMLSRTAVNTAPVFMTTTWYAINWLMWLVYKPWQDKNPNYNVIEWSSFDSPWFPEQDRAELRRACGSDAEFQRRFMGKAAQMEGLVYPDFNRAIHVIKPIELKNVKRFAGIDFGYTRDHPTAGVFMSQDDKGCIYIERYYHKVKGLMEVHADGVRSRVLGTPMTIWGDAAAQQEIAELSNFFRGSGVSIVPSTRKVGVNIGIDKIGRFLRQRKLLIFDTEENQGLIDEFETYSWKENVNLNAQDKVVKYKDDGLDALRYGITNAVLSPPEEQAQIKFTPKPVPVTNPITGYPTGEFRMERSAVSFRQKWGLGYKIK